MAGKKSEKPAAKKKAGFSLFDADVSFGNAVKESLSESAWLANRQIISIPEFPMRWLWNSRGFQSGTIIDIMGGDHLGKTSLKYTIMGWFMRHNCPALDIETENKPMLPDRIRQCLHTDKRMAALMFDNGLTQWQAFDIETMVEQVATYLKLVRTSKDITTRVPKNIPVVIGLDTWSKLLTPAEAEALAIYGLGEPDPEDEEGKGHGKKKKEIKDLSEGSNFGHAKLAQKWCRQLPMVLSEHNAVLILVRHQNDKIDMGKVFGGGSLLSPEVKDTINRTSIGGRAFNQSAAYQVILSPSRPEKASVRGEMTKVGQWVRASVSKNSYAPERKMEYLINFFATGETETYLDPALDFDRALPECLKATGMYPSLRQIKNNVYACKDLGIEQGTSREIAMAFYREPERLEALTQQLRMVGSQPEFKVLEGAAPTLSLVPSAPEVQEEAA
jgi:hypothetical protein